MYSKLTNFLDVLNLTYLVMAYHIVDAQLRPWIFSSYSSVTIRFLTHRFLPYLTSAFSLCHMTSARM